MRRAIFQSEPIRSSQTSSVDPRPHHVTNTRAQRPTTVIVVRDGRSSRLESHGADASGHAARVHAGSSLGAGQRAAIFPTVK